MQLKYTQTFDRQMLYVISDFRAIRFTLSFLEMSKPSKYIYCVIYFDAEILPHPGKCYMKCTFPRLEKEPVIKQTLDRDRICCRFLLATSRFCEQGDCTIVPEGVRGKRRDLLITRDLS